MEKTLILLTLLQIPKIGRKTILSLFQSRDEVPTDLDQLYDFLLTVRDKRLVNVKRNDLLETADIAKRIIEESANKEIRILSFFDDVYPESLKKIDDPPILVYLKGDSSCLAIDNKVAIIGSRKPSEHGMKIAHRLGSQFVKLDFGIVSGLALGCDSGAHNGALEAKGKTIAVLPAGLDNIYPASNKKLGERIINNGGCLISEYPVGSKPLKANFVERDRIQSALSKGVIVVETEATGGTMHTVRFAEKYGKPIACYKHSEKYSELKQASGNRLLLSQGRAIPLADEDDIQSFTRKMLNFEDIDNTNKADDIKTEQITIAFDLEKD